MNDASFWLAAGSAAVGLTVGLIAKTLAVSRAIVTKAECEATVARREKACTACHAEIMVRGSVEQAIAASAESTRRSTRNEMQSALLRHESLEGHAGTLKRLVDVERAVAVYSERFDGERRQLTTINEKLDRILDAMPSLTARVESLERHNRHTAEPS